MSVGIIQKCECGIIRGSVFYVSELEGIAGVRRLRKDDFKYNAFKTFMTMLVRAKSCEGRRDLRTGRNDVDCVFPVEGSLESFTDEGNTSLNTELSWKEQDFNGLPPILSGPDTFPGFTLLKVDSTVLPSISKTASLVRLLLSFFTLSLRLETTANRSPCKWVRSNLKLKSFKWLANADFSSSLSWHTDSGGLHWPVIIVR